MVYVTVVGVETMKDITSSVYNFEDLIQGNFLYVDKAEYIWQLIRPAKGMYFLSRPRRFGKSLTISMLKAVFAGNKELFNTLAVNGNPVEMTSFGETADKNAFFTGKPMIDELGYSFLFRDYNPNQGKWTTTDPLGYPDGWNNLAYVNNRASIAWDWLGCLTESITDSIDTTIMAETAWDIKYVSGKKNQDYTIKVDFYMSGNSLKTNKIKE